MMPFAWVAPDQKLVAQVFRIADLRQEVKNAWVLSIVQLHRARFEFCGLTVLTAS